LLGFRGGELEEEGEEEDEYSKSVATTEESSNSNPNDNNNHSFSQEGDDIISSFQERLREIRSEMESEALKEMKNLREQLMESRRYRYSKQVNEEEEEEQQQQNYEMKKEEIVDINDDDDDDDSDTSSSHENDRKDTSEYGESDHPIVDDKDSSRDINFVMGETDESEEGVFEKLHREEEMVTASSFHEEHLKEVTNAHTQKRDVVDDNDIDNDHDNDTDDNINNMEQQYSETIQKEKNKKKNKKYSKKKKSEGKAKAKAKLENKRTKKKQRRALDKHSTKKDSTKKAKIVHTKNIIPGEDSENFMMRPRLRTIVQSGLILLLVVVVNLVLKNVSKIIFNQIFN